MAKQHPTPDNYIAKAKEELAQATAFVKQKDLLTLPARSNLDVIETPEFMRGIYGVGGFNPAPPLSRSSARFTGSRRFPRLGRLTASNRSSGSTTTTDCRS